MEAIIARCAGLDIGKRQVQACVRTPDPDDPTGGRRVQTRTFLTFTAGLEQLADWLTNEQVTDVVMEATGQYWKPVWYALEDHAFTLMLVNAQHVKILPGRKTDVADAAWLAELLEHGLLRGSFVPEPEIRRLRDLTRYRKKLVQTRTSEVQRLSKHLEDAGIKLDSVASDLLGVSGRAMLAALVDGERDPAVLAELAKGRLRAKLPDLREALRGRFTDHHGFLVRVGLEHLAQLEHHIGELDERVEELIGPFARARDHLMTIPGIGTRAAANLIAEIGVDMTRFPTAAHLASWACMCPGNNITGGKRKTGTTRRGNPWIRDLLVESAWSASHTRDTYLRAQFWRLARRIGKKKAAVAVGHTILVIAWHLLSTDTDYHDLGADHYQHRHDNPRRARDRHIAELQQLGYHVTITPAA